MFNRMQSTGVYSTQGNSVTILTDDLIFYSSNLSRESMCEYSQVCKLDVCCVSLLVRLVAAAAWMEVTSAAAAWMEVRTAAAAWMEVRTAAAAWMEVRSAAAAWMEVMTADGVDMPRDHWSIGQ